MAWSFIASSSSAAGANPVVNLPTGWQVGDLLVLVAVGESTYSAAPSGWNSIITNGSSTTSGSLTVWYKFAVSGESGLSLTNSSSTSNAHILAYRSVLSFDAAGTVASATAGTTLSTNTFSTTAGNDLVISAWCCTSTQATWTAPADTNTRVTRTPGGAACGVLVVDEPKMPTGTTTSRTATLSVTGLSRACIAFSFKQTTGDFFAMF